MFGEHKDKMRPGPTPERVLSLCRMVADSPISREEVQLRLYIEDASNTDEAFSSTLKVACEELGIIKLKDGKYSLAVDANVLSDSRSFRRYVAEKVFLNPNTSFFMVTKWFLSKNESIFNHGNWEDKAVAAGKDGIKGLTDNDMLGWRFWAAFLGEGYPNKTDLIPNMYIRLRDAIQSHYQESFSFDERVSIEQFLRWIRKHIPEVPDQEGQVCLALSNALRTMRDLNEMELVAERDAVRIQLYPVNDMTNDISHVIVKEAIVV